MVVVVSFFNYFFYTHSGLTSVYRHQAGHVPDDDNDVDMYGNNQHWLHEASQPSNVCAYYDAASLYPTSGIYYYFFVTPTLPPIPSLFFFRRGSVTGGTAQSAGLPDPRPRP